MAGVRERKPRPADGPGANGLRGGKNIYSSKTVIGNWLDEIGGPSFYKRGFSTEDFRTEQQMQQLGATLKPPQYYGAGIPHPNTVRLEPATTFDVFCPGGKSASTWTTNSKATMDEGLIKKEEPFLKMTESRAKFLEDYRKTWTSDTPISREVRFKTENRLAGNAAPKPFQTVSLRLLPGTPMAVEKFRKAIIERHGVLGLSALRYYVGKGTINVDQFKTIVKKLQINFGPAEVNQVIAFFTPKDSINTEQVIKTVVARTEGFDPSFARSHFKDLQARSANAGGVPLAVIQESLNSQQYPEVVIGLQEYLSAYTDNDDCLSIENYILVHSDLYASEPDSYQELTQSFFMK